MFGKFVAIMLVSGLATPAFATQCTVTVDSTDRMTYSTKEIVVDKSCKAFTVKLTHSGNLPINVMGHNLVISKAADMHAIAAEGLPLGAENSYVKGDDPRVIAHTKLIGGAVKDDMITLDTSALEAGGDYSFFCTFPGHISVMKGKVIVK